MAQFLHQLELFRVCIWAQSCILVFSAFWHRLKNTMILYRFLSVNVALSLGFKLKLLPFPVIFLNTETFKPCLTVINKPLCAKYLMQTFFSWKQTLAQRLHFWSPTGIYTIFCRFARFHVTLKQLMWSNIIKSVCAPKKTHYWLCFLRRICKLMFLLHVHVGLLQQCVMWNAQHYSM